MTYNVLMGTLNLTHSSYSSQNRPLSLGALNWERFRSSKQPVGKSRRVTWFSRARQCDREYLTVGASDGPTDRPPTAIATYISTRIRVRRARVASIFRQFRDAEAINRMTPAGLDFTTGRRSVRARRSDRYRCPAKHTGPPLLTVWTFWSTSVIFARFRGQRLLGGVVCRQLGLRSTGCTGFDSPAIRAFRRRSWASSFTQTHASYHQAV